METNLLAAANNVCRCDHRAPALRVLRSTAFNTALAGYVDALNLSGDGIVDWVLTELFEHRTGALIGPDGTTIPIDSDSALTDDLFGEDTCRSINRYRERASKRFRYRLQTRMVWPVTLMHFVREIHLCRTIGPCASG